MKQEISTFGFQGVNKGKTISSPLDSSLASLPIAWYDFSDASSLTVNDDGTGGVPGNGGMIGRCKDKSGNAYHLKQAVDVQRPTYNTALLNGLGGARFDGIDDSLLSPFVAGWNRTQTTFVVFKQITNVSGKRIIDGYYCNTGGVYQDGGKEVIIYAGAVGASSQGLTIGLFNIGTFIISANDSVIELSNGLNTGSNAAQGHDMGGLSVGNIGVGCSTNYSNIEVMEIVCFNVLLPIVDRRKIVDYLSNKYKL